MPEPIDTGDFKDFQDALTALPRMSSNLGMRAVGLALESVREIMAPYPPQPDRERSGSFNTYVRGVGNYPKSSFKQMADGTWKPSRKLAAGKIKFTSQRLSTKWRISIAQSAESVDGELSNEAGYSGFVLGHKKGVQANDNVPEQVDFHATTGWSNIEDAMAQAEGKISAAFEDIADELVLFIKGPGA